MKRDEKATVIEEIAAQIKAAEAIYATDYRGITVSQVAQLRATLRDVDASFRVVKNTLTLLAADKAGADVVKELVEGPTAFTFVHGDPAIAAKALDTFARRENVLELRGGLLDGQLLDADTVKQLARLPAREQLNAQFVAVVAAPITGLVRGLGALVSGLAIALGQVREKKEAESPEAPAAPEPQVDEAPASEEPQADEPTAAEDSQADEAPASEGPQAEAPAAEEQPQAEAGEQQDQTPAEGGAEAEANEKEAE
jgi:large subunit ribosomal protein L10